jgi:hypothetical protein
MNHCVSAASARPPNPFCALENGATKASQRLQQRPGRGWLGLCDSRFFSSPGSHICYTAVHSCPALATRGQDSYQLLLRQRGTGRPCEQVAEAFATGETVSVIRAPVEAEGNTSDGSALPSTSKP